MTCKDMGTWLNGINFLRSKTVMVSFWNFSYTEKEIYNCSHVTAWNVRTNTSHGKTNYETKPKENEEGDEDGQSEARQGNYKPRRQQLATQVSSRENKNPKTSSYCRGFLKIYTIFDRKENGLKKIQIKAKIILICWESVERISRKEAVCHTVFQVLLLSYGLDRSVSFG